MKVVFNATLTGTKEDIKGRLFLIFLEITGVAQRRRSGVEMSWSLSVGDGYKTRPFIFVMFYPVINAPVPHRIRAFIPFIVCCFGFTIHRSPFIKHSSCNNGQLFSVREDVTMLPEYYLDYSYHRIS